MSIIKGIIFDKDGTLFDYAQVWANGVKALFDKMVAEFKIKDIDRAKLDFYKIVGIADDHTRYKDGILFHPDKKLRSSIMLLQYTAKYKINPIKLYHLITSYLVDPSLSITHELESIDFSKARTLLQRLKERGVIIGIVTNDSERSTKKCLDSMKIAEYVSYIRTKESNCKRKPHPDGILQFCKEFNLKNDEIAVVGDAIIDMRFAKSAKAKYLIGVLTGSQDYDGLINNGANVIYDDIFAILTDKTIFPGDSY